MPSSRFCCSIAVAIAIVLIANTETRGQVEPLLPSAEQRPAESGRDDNQFITVEGDGPSDTRIAERLRAIFEAIDTLSKVQVGVVSGVVTLRGTTPGAVEATEALEIAQRVDGVVAVVDRIEAADSVAESLEPGVDRIARRLRDGLRILPLVGIGVAIFALFAGLGVALSHWRAPFSRLAPNAFIAGLAAHAVRALFIIIGIVAALEFIGATALLGAILGAAGILGLAIGFAVRDTIENYVSSVLLSLRQPFSPNDFVTIQDHQGFVLRLTSRATVLLTLDGNHVRIPNSTVFKSTIVNFTRKPERRFDFVLGVNADANLKAAIQLSVTTLHGLEFVLAEPKPTAWIETVGDSSVIIRFGAWIDQRATDFFQARSEAIRLVKRALEAADFELPEPIYRLRFEQNLMSLDPQAHASTPGGYEGSNESPEVGNTSNLAEMKTKVTEERRRQDDLLDTEAPKE